jgi:hypothetical protein
MALQIPEWLVQQITALAEARAIRLELEIRRFRDAGVPLDDLDIVVPPCPERPWVRTVQPYGSDDSLPSA